MNDDLRHRYAEALAAKFTYPVYRCDRDGENERVENADPADRIDQTPYVMVTAGDGCRSFWTPTCADLAEVVAAVRDEELERLQGVIDRHDQGIMPVCEGYMASKAQQAERERDGWRERAETVRMMARQWAELAAPGDACAERMDLAIADCGRAVLAALDDSQETDRGR